MINEENDLHSLIPMIEKIKEDAGNLPGKVLADAGYSSGEQLLEAEKKDMKCWQI